jgi:hypothetical protein
VATLAWNTTRHLEAWYGIMGLGAVCHTLNPRLSDKDLVYIINHAGGWRLGGWFWGAPASNWLAGWLGGRRAGRHAAPGGDSAAPPLDGRRAATTDAAAAPAPAPAPRAGDAALLADLSFVPILARVLPHCPSVKSVVILTDRCGGCRAGGLEAWRRFGSLGQARQTRGAGGASTATRLPPPLLLPHPAPARPPARPPQAAHARPRRAAARAVLRRAAGGAAGRAARLRLGAGARGGPLRAVLHLGHHRQPQGAWRPLLWPAGPAGPAA